MLFAFWNETEDNKVVLIDANDKHMAIAQYVKKYHNNDMADFYYGLDDGQCQVYDVEQ